MLHRNSRLLIILAVTLTVLLSACEVTEEIVTNSAINLYPSHPASQVIALAKTLDLDLYNKTYAATEDKIYERLVDYTPDVSLSTYTDRRTYYDSQELAQANLIIDHYATQGYLCEPTLSGMKKATINAYDNSAREGLFDAYKASVENGVKTGQKCIPGAIASVSSAPSAPPGPPQNPEPNTPISPLTDLE